MRVCFPGVVLLLLGVSAPGVLAAQQPNPDRNAYFGETHLHTSWSLDAWLFGNRVTDPGDAYKYFQGQTIKHPLGYDIKIETPLDWGGVTDHSEYVGVIRLANDPTSPISKLPAAQPLVLKNASPEEVQRIFDYGVKVLMGGPPIPSLMSPEVAGTVWKQNTDLANAANKPGKFTAFCSYEWTSMPNSMNLHRNIFFRDCGKLPAMPFSALDSQHPEDLWQWMDGQRSAGNELLAISHNANLSDGRMYPTEVDSRGRPIDAAWADSRTRNERLIEIKQIKGTSETHPLLSPNDEFAGYEIMSILLGDPVGRIPHIVGSYTRQALKDGIAMGDVKGYNPYKFGFGAAADAHNSAAPYRHSNFFGAHGVADGTIERRMSGYNFSGIDVRTETTAGLTGVWAEENTRTSIFDAMKRRETFAVSGPHIKVRFFGGWGYTPAMLAARDWVKEGYAKGVPMGSDLPPAAGKAPTFVVWAVKDPTSGNLDRIQIIKGWTVNGQSFERVYDVAWSGTRKAGKWTGVVGPVGSTVNLETATYTNTIGSVELKKVWTDPEFDPALHAFYYARVLEIPTPRWTTIQAKQVGIAPPDVVPAEVQERAWSSPIWYSPSTQARSGAKAGTTVADLVKQGATALTSEQLATLIVHQSVWLENTVTGDKYQVIYGASGPVKSAEPLTPSEPGFVTSQFAANQGMMRLKYIGQKMRLPSLMGDAAEASRIGATRPYFINDGKIVTELGGTPVTIAVYKVGDKYYGARSNEFGYANYMIVPAVELLDPIGIPPGSGKAP